MAQKSIQSSSLPVRVGRVLYSDPCQPGRDRLGSAVETREPSFRDSWAITTSLHHPDYYVRVQIVVCHT